MHGGQESFSKSYGGLGLTPNQQLAVTHSASRTPGDAAGRALDPATTDVHPAVPDPGDLEEMPVFVPHRALPSM